jgi:hypothetical protein
MGASRSFGLAHARIFAPAPKVVNSKKRAIPTINRESVSVLSMEHLNLEMSRTGDQTRWGGTVGAGIEFSFAPNWSAGDHLFMGTKTVTFTDTAGVFFGTDRIRQDVDLVTVRVNYRLGGPVVGRY